VRTRERRRAGAKRGEGKIRERGGEGRERES